MLYVVQYVLHNSCYVNIGMFHIEEIIAFFLHGSVP